MSAKTCKKCGKPAGKKGLRCDACRAESERERYRQNSTQINMRRRHAYDPDLDFERRLKYRYNTTVEWYNETLEKQGGVCGICFEQFEPHVDHSHSCCSGNKSCGECLRGLLCSSCNNGLGRFKDDAERLRSAIAWLER